MLTSLYRLVVRKNISHRIYNLRSKFIIIKMQSSNFKSVNDNINFAKNEEEILNFWDEIKAFETQLKKTENCPKYTFYDGPPFATGLPHYGHITAGTIKDVVTRYWTQTGRYVPRKFGWDCHGLPIEVVINEKLNIKTKKDLLNIGIKTYNSECRDIVMTYSNEWRWYTRRFGRWIDFENDYKTLDLNFMESVWWVFKQIFDKGLVYRKCKVMPYSCACNTVLSNFEAGSNYKEVNDPSVIITLPLVTNPKIKLLAWTTTPWTLPSNLFLAVNPNLTYVHIQVEGDEEKQYILAEALLKDVATKLKIDGKYTIIEKMTGTSLSGWEYLPLFNDFHSKFHPKGCFRVYTADYVSSSDGTGIVHNAPGFGEDDYCVGVKYNLVDADKPLCPVDEDGCFTDEFPLCAGKFFKDADPIIIENLKSRGRLVYSGSIGHKYPLCYRTNTPLMYRAIPSWFIRVEDLKEDLLTNNKKAYWVPKYVQEKRFHNWLADARDWCFSRNRAWGNPIPIWVSDDLEEVVCVGSVEELKKLSGVQDIKDLHREFIDHITIPSQKGKGQLKRIEEVFDCWFESGSMPYAQIHYPFEVNDEHFKQIYPADFIAEGLDQTRGWFYTLNVISTALFNTNPYKNLIVNGLVLAENGEKLSKSKKNYDDPKNIFSEFGADATRLYLIDSPLVKGQSLRFSKKGLMEVIKDVFLPLYNSYRFLIQNIQRYESSSGKLFFYNADTLKNESLNITDRWIIAYNQRLIKFVRTEMENYRLYTVVDELLNFLDKLTNWYIRLNRSRIKGDFGVEDCLNSLNVLFSTLLNLVILLSPFIPFLTETIYQNLRNGLQSGNALLEDSIHYLRIPQADESLIDLKIEDIMRNMISVIELGRQLREKKGISLKKPVAAVEIINFDKTFLNNIKVIENYVIDELNANEIIYQEQEEKFIKLSAKPNFEVLYKKCKEISETMKDEEREDDPELKAEADKAKKEANAIAAVIKTLDEFEVRELIINHTINKNGTVITVDKVILEKKFLPEYEKDKVFICLSNQECGIRINTSVDENILNVYYCREVNYFLT
jgi:isoleucyl-tRNA synthetase